MIFSLRGNISKRLIFTVTEQLDGGGLRVVDLDFLGVNLVVKNVLNDDIIDLIV